jgi:hypothetical protein
LISFPKRREKLEPGNVIDMNPHKICNDVIVLAVLIELSRNMTFMTIENEQVIGANRRYGAESIQILIDLLSSHCRSLQAPSQVVNYFPDTMS